MYYNLYVKKKRAKKWVLQASSPFSSKARAKRIAQTTFKTYHTRILPIKNIEAAFWYKGFSSNKLITFRHRKSSHIRIHITKQFKGYATSYWHPFKSPILKYFKTKSKALKYAKVLMKKYAWIF